MKTSRTRSLSSPPRMETTKAPTQTPKSAPTAEAKEAKPQVLRREDDYFTNATFKKNGKENKKAHLSMEDHNRGSMIPVNKDGKTTPYGHVQGDAVQKQNSPYTSFSPGEHQGAKPYGKFEMEVNRTKLEQDIQAGKVHGVEVLDNAKVQDSIRQDIEKNTGVKVSSPVPHDKIDDFVKDQGLGKKKSEKLQNRMQALANTHRDQEVLVKGEIPTEYVRRVGLNQKDYAKLSTELKEAVAAREERLKKAGPSNS